MAESIIKRHKAQIEVLTEESNQSNKLVLELNKQLKLFQIKKSSTNSQSILLSTVSECTESSNYSDSTPSKTFESTASRVTFSDDEEIWDITSLQNSKNNLNQDSEVDLLSEGDTLSTIPPQETSRALKPIEKKKKESSFLSTVAQQNSTVSIENSTEVDSDEEVIIGGTINEITLSEVESSTPNNKLQASKLVSEDSFITSTVQTTTNLQTESEATNLATSTEHSMSQSRLSSTVDTQSETFSEVNTELVSRTEEFTSSDADNVSKSEFNVESSNSSDSEKPKASFSAPNEVFSDTDMETSKSFTTSHSNFEYFSSDESNEVERTREIPKKKVLHERSSSEGSFISIPKESGEEPRVHLSRVSSKSSIALETESLEFSKKNKNEIDEDIEIEKKNLELLVDEPKSNLLDVELELKKNLESTSTSKKSLVSIKAKKNSSTRSSIASKKTVPDNNFNDPFFNKFAENNGGFGKKNSSENQIASTLPPIAAGSTLSLYRSGSKSSLNKPASHVRTLSNSQNDQDSIFLNKSTPASINNTSNFNVTSKVSRESLEEQVEMMPPIEKKYTSSQHSRKSSESPSFTNKDFTSKTEFSQKKKKIPSLSSNSSLKSLSELKNEDEKKILKKSSSSADLSVKINNSNSQNSTVFGSSSIKSKKNSMEKIKKSPSSNSISLKKSISSIGDLEDEILEEMKSVEEKKLSSPSVQKIDSIIVDPVDSPTTNDAKFENFFSTPSQLEKIIKNSLENSTGALPKLQQLNPLISKQSLMDSVNFGKGEKTVSTPVPPSLTKNKSVASIRSAKYSIGGATQMNENNTTTDANISSSYMSNNKKVVGNVSNSSLNSESQSDYTTNSSNVNSSQTATTSHLTTSVVSSSNPSKNTNTTTSSSELVTSTNPSGSNADDDSRGNSLSKNSDGIKIKKKKKFFFILIPFFYLR
ncbi:hypothetical protein HK099_001197 [Clydaea vesicula]|uniref:Uncharacterized protein n=1 Tax=Clydaea vesicula TaxID=447962 RepID=A0AAD5TX05_9FUNG|nr:hypothetical protein HK099_001197 [Clydaea vesicula]